MKSNEKYIFSMKSFTSKPPCEKPKFAVACQLAWIQCDYSDIMYLAPQLSSQHEGIYFKKDGAHVV